ncbi:putative magnesium transporter NIPA8 [Chlorella vulgaris]
MQTGTALLGLGSLGAALHVAGSVLIVFGQASVKTAHAIVDSTGAPSTWAVPRSHPQPPLWRRPDGKWRRQKAGSKAYSVGGWSAFALGNILRFIAMRFAAQTVLSGLGSLQFVIIPVASRFMLGIRASAATLLGVVVVLVGNALIILYGPAEVTFTLEQLRAQWASPAMTTFLLVLGGLLCLLQWLHYRITGGSMGLQPQPQLAATLEGGGGRAQSGGLQSSSGSGEVLPSDSQHLLAAGSGKWIDCNSKLGLAQLSREQDAVSVFAGALLFSAVASFVGAWSVLFSKSLTYVVTYMPASLTDWYSWFVLAAFLGTAAFWVRQSDRGLRFYPASLIMPLMQAFWMCMSVLEGGIYFEELVGLPSRHLALLLLGLLLALLGAIFMGIAGFVAEKPEHIFHYSAASSELTAADGGSSGGTDSLSSQSPAMVDVIVEKVHGASGRVDRLSSPVLRAGGSKNGYAHSGGPGLDVEASKRWWQQNSSGGSGGGIQLHASSDLRIELPHRGGSSTPQGLSPAAMARLEAVRSPTQQLLNRENSSSLDGLLPGGVTTAFDRVLGEEAAGVAESAGSGSTGGVQQPGESVVLLHTRTTSKGPLQRR